jgi:hypothetical protein
MISLVPVKVMCPDAVGNASAVAAYPSQACFAFSAAALPVHFHNVPALAPLTSPPAPNVPILRHMPPLPTHPRDAHEAPASGLAP